MRTRHSCGAGLAFALLAAAGALAAEIGETTDWPLERIVANLERRLIDSPDEFELHFNLGRAHAFAFALERSSLWTRDRGDDHIYVKDIGVQRSLTQQARERDAAPDQRTPTPGELLDHLAPGVRHLRRAVELARFPDPSAMSEISLAWLLETGAHLASRVDTAALFDLHAPEQGAARVRQTLRELVEAPDPLQAIRALRPGSLAEMAAYCASRPISSRADEQAVIDALLEQFWLEKAIERYRCVVERLLAGMGNVRDENHMDYVREAHAAMTRLVAARGVRDAAEQETLSAIQARITEVENLKRGKRGIDPILLAVDSCKILDELIAPDLAVPFDLDGDAVDELWPWIAPGTGWLVWDPEGRGEITSGLQLFGTASAWLFFADGYRVLDALDDDRDGVLRGAELAGIAVWFDRDTDGVSDRGEVVPVEDLGIVALSTEATEQLGASLGNPCGLELADGRILPTYDWVLAPISP